MWIRASICGPASVARSTTGHASRVARSAGGPPEAKKMGYMSEYMPETHVETKCV